jgi:hypothetical protein
MNKRINFHLYRYHLNPISSKSAQIEMFPKHKLTAAEIKEKKNDFFKAVLEKHLALGSPSNPMAIHDNEDEFYLFKVANFKNTTITKNFKKEEHAHEPYVYVIINNNPSTQKIAISENIDAFSTPDTVKNLLLKIFLRELGKFGLNIEIEKLFDAGDFWEYVNKHKDSIKKIQFEFIKPNLADISNSLPKALKDFQNKTNAHKAVIAIEAPERGKLEKIDTKNKAVSGLVNYSAQGGGNIKLKVRNIRKQIQTEEKPIILQIEEAEIEGAANQVIKLYKALVE